MKARIWGGFALSSCPPLGQLPPGAELRWSDTEPSLCLPGTSGQPSTRAHLAFILSALAAVPLPKTCCGAPGTRPCSQSARPTEASVALGGAKGAG